MVMSQPPSRYSGVFYESHKHGVDSINSRHNQIKTYAPLYRYWNDLGNKAREHGKSDSAVYYFNKAEFCRSIAHEHEQKRDEEMHDLETSTHQ